MYPSSAASATHAHRAAWMQFFERVRVLLASMILMGGLAIIIKIGGVVGWLCVIGAAAMLARALRVARGGRSRATRRTLLVVELSGQAVVLVAILNYFGVL